jgi:hypothetical protein
MADESEDILIAEPYACGEMWSENSKTALLTAFTIAKVCLQV